MSRLRLEVLDYAPDARVTTPRGLRLYLDDHEITDIVDIKLHASRESTWECTLTMLVAPESLVKVPPAEWGKS